MKILIVDDEENIRETLKKILVLDGFQVGCAENGLSAQRMIGESYYDLAVVDLKMPGMDGMELLEWIGDEGIPLPVIMISAHGQINDAVRAMKAGAADFITKPFNMDELSLRIGRLSEIRRGRELLEEEISRDEENYICYSPGMKKLEQLLERAARTPSNILITGESGSGKEVTANHIHKLSAVSRGPFVPINIGGVPENLLESELFGYEKGAFTGADSRKLGLFETAVGGTLFLDEIGEMPPALQVKLLRVLQERKVRRLGGIKDIPINVRIIAATNRDLERDVKEERFREDLYYRLNVVRLALPPLRERREDLIPLAALIIRKLNRKMGRTVKDLSPGAVDRLISYSFPGNIRELENILERSLIFSEEEILTEGDLDIPAGKIPGRSEESRRRDWEGLTLREREKKAIEEALHRWEGNRTRAAQELGISRRTIIYKIQEYELDV